MAEWTNEQERALLTAHAQSPRTPNRALAAQLTDMFGLPFTEDAVQKKLKRIKEQLEIDATTFDGEIPNTMPSGPRERFVGFNIAFFDIETTDLKAFMGRILGASIADCFGNITHRTYKDFGGKTILDDSGIAGWLKDELEKYDILVSWNGKLFDSPFINARLMRGLQLPVRSDMKHLDLMYYAKGQFMRIGSAKLDNVAKFLKVDNQKTPISWDAWALAATGDDAALADVMEHCDADVLVLGDVFERLKPLVKIVHR
jgi:DNA polymerase elongation subunit (family B)